MPDEALLMNIEKDPGLKGSTVFYDLTNAVGHRSHDLFMGQLISKINVSAFNKMTHFGVTLAELILDRHAVLDLSNELTFKILNSCNINAHSNSNNKPLIWTIIENYKPRKLNLSSAQLFTLLNKADFDLEVNQNNLGVSILKNYQMQGLPLNKEHLTLLLKRSNFDLTLPNTKYSAAAFFLSNSNPQLLEPYSLSEIENIFVGSGQTGKQLVDNLLLFYSMNSDDSLDVIREHKDVFLKHNIVEYIDDFIQHNTPGFGSERLSAAKALLEKLHIENTTAIIGKTKKLKTL